MKFSNAPAWTLAKKIQMIDNFTKPGPGNYNVATSSKVPSSKIGKSARQAHHSKQAPGPGDYNISAKNSAPKLTIFGKNNVHHADNTPGPGNYNPNSNAVYKKTSSFTLGYKYHQKSKGNYPGPGAYQPQLAYKRGVKIGRQQRKTAFDNEMPGPGAYNPTARPYSAGPRYGFKRDNKSMWNANNYPGAGEYDINNPSNRYKGYTMGEKFHQSQRLDDTPGPGHYLYDDTYRYVSGSKIGKGPKVPNQHASSVGPGAYDLDYKSKNGPSAKIGSSTRNQNNRGMSPGPGSYDLNPDKPHGIIISKSKNNDNMQPTPGPGHYDPNLDGSKPRPSTAKVGKGTRQTKEKNDTPGPGFYLKDKGSPPKFAYSKEERSKELTSKDPGPGQYNIPATVPSAPSYGVNPAIFKL